MILRKDDPVYYKEQLTKLIALAETEGLHVKCYKENDKIRISFEESKYNIASVELWLENNE